MVAITTSYTDYTTSKYTWVYINNNTCSNSQQINIIRLFWCHCPPSILNAVNKVFNTVRDLTKLVQNQLSNYSVNLIQLFLRFICMHFEITHALVRCYWLFTQNMMRIPIKFWNKQRRSGFRSIRMSFNLFRIFAIQNLRDN